MRTDDYLEIPSCPSPYDDDNAENNNDAIRLRREDTNVVVETCRICLESDRPDTMIAPCLCKGSAKWVHRECLDEWRIHERDRAFSRCTECLFPYRLTVTVDERRRRRRRRRFRCLVLRDLCCGHAILQVVVICLGGALWFAFPNLFPNVVRGEMGNHDYASSRSRYYAAGWLALFVVLGLYGSFRLIGSGCSFHRASSSSSSSSFATDGDDETDPVIRRPRERDRDPDFYRRRRRRRDDDDGGDRCSGCCWYAIHCDGCCPATTPLGGCGDALGTFARGATCQGCEHVMLALFLVAAVVVVTIGFVEGVLVGVLFFRSVVRRHVHLLRKRRLVEEYVVADLADVDDPVSLEEATAAETVAVREEDEDMAEFNGGRLSLGDATFLKGLGLMDDDQHADEEHCSNGRT